MIREDPPGTFLEEFRKREGPELADRVIAVLGLIQSRAMRERDLKLESNPKAPLEVTLPVDDRVLRELFMSRRRSWTACARARLRFNYRSSFTSPWDDAGLQARHDFSAEYRGDAQRSVKLEL